MLTRQNVPSPMRSHLVSDVGSHEESSLSDAQFRRLAKDFAQIVWRRSADGASVTHDITITATVLPENLTVQLDPPGFFLGETEDVAVTVRSTYRRDLPGLLIFNPADPSAFSP